MHGTLYFYNVLCQMKVNIIISKDRSTRRERKVCPTLTSYTKTCDEHRKVKKCMNMTCELHKMSGSRPCCLVKSHTRLPVVMKGQ
jgi:hypothetical protein